MQPRLPPARSSYKPFDNLRALRSYTGPLLVVHGKADDLVPVEHGRLLSAAVPGAEFHELPCGHNDCPPIWDLVQSFLERRQLLRPLDAGKGLGTISGAAPAAGRQ